MTSEGWGTPEWLPERVQRRAAIYEAREAREEREAERELEAQREERHNRAMGAYMAACQERGDPIDVAALAAGELPARSISDVLADAAAAAARDDARDAIRAHREGHGEPEKLHIEFGEPVIHEPAARSETGRRMANIRRHFTARLEARKALDQAERAANASRDDYGYVCAAPRSQRSAQLTAADQRAGGPEPGFGPYNVPWSEVGRWIGQGWRP